MENIIFQGLGWVVNLWLMLLSEQTDWASCRSIWGTAGRQMFSVTLSSWSNDKSDLKEISVVPLLVFTRGKCASGTEAVPEAEADDRVLSFCHFFQWYVSVLWKLNDFNTCTLTLSFPFEFAIVVNDTQIFRGLEQCGGESEAELILRSTPDGTGD